MSTKKKVDLTSELADLLMEDPAGTTEFGATRQLTRQTEAKTSDTRQLPSVAPESPAKADQDHDPTLAIRSSAPKSVADKEPEATLSAVTETPASEKTIETIKKPTPSAETQFGGLSQIFGKSSSQQDSVAKRTGGKSDILLTAEGALIQSEQLRVAQERILELERIVENLRIENEELHAAGETLRSKNDELQSQLEKSAELQKEKHDSLREELVVAKTALSSKSDEVGRLHLKIEELETRLAGDLKRIRVRERELENRLEILKLENQAILKNKDEVILDLKRKIDQLGFELEGHRGKGRELNRQVEDHKERVRRTVKALRLALTMLEGEEEGNPLKKAE